MAMLVLMIAACVIALVAAMRALVLDTLGETVQVPQEISC